MPRQYPRTMTREEFMNLEAIKIKDIQECFGTSYDTARKIMREIKSVADRTRTTGMCLRQDYIDYTNKWGEVAQCQQLCQ